MRRILPAALLIACLALTGAAGAQTRDDIMDRVIWPCVDREVQELDLAEHHSEPAATVMFELGREFYEEVIDAVEAAFREHTDDASEWIYEAGLAACLQNQDTWEGEQQ